MKGKLTSTATELVDIFSITNLFSYLPVENRGSMLNCTGLITLGASSMGSLTALRIAVRICGGTVISLWASARCALGRHPELFRHGKGLVWSVKREAKGKVKHENS